MTDVLDSARAAIDRHAWSEAFELLRAHDESHGLQAHGLEMLGEVAWWTSDIQACIDARERAYAAYVAAGEALQAGQVCVCLAEDHFHRRAESVANGWLHRAERLLEQHPQTVQYGWLARLQSSVAFEGKGDVETAIAHARTAYDIATRFDDYDLQSLSLHDQGRILLASGKVEEGLGLMEEAMARAVSGELSARVIGRIYCNMIEACEELAEYKRAYEWDEAARRWCDRVGNESGFPGICRVKRAEILRHHGTWDEAEAEAQRACEELGDFLDFAARGFTAIGEIRLRMGDYSGAEEAFGRAREIGHDAEPGLALLHLAKSDSDTAWQLITHALDGVGLPLQRARLLPARIEVALASGHVDTAQQDVSELRNIADEFQSAALLAAATYGMGVLALEQGRADEAVESLELAGRLWSKGGDAYEAARSRLNAGLAYRRRGAEELARLEIDAARSIFARLGARPALQQATALLDSGPEPGSEGPPIDQPDSAPRGGPGAPFDLLTPREMEILELIAQGLSNRDIAERLNVSGHTVRNHINRLFSKLDVRDRAQAIVAAHRAGIGVGD